MKEHPLPFKAAMIRALNRGIKTQTRRLVTKRNSDVASARWDDLCLESPRVHIDGRSSDPRCEYLHVPHSDGETSHRVRPKWQPGERIWAKETWSPDCTVVYPCPPAWFRADFGQYEDPRVADHNTEKCRKSLNAGDCFACMRDRYGFKWRPSIFMPRRVARIVREITEVRAQRLQDITDEDAKAEGIREIPLQEGQPGAWWTADPLAGRPLQARTPRDAFQLLWESINGPVSWVSNPRVWALTFKRVT